MAKRKPRKKSGPPPLREEDGTIRAEFVAQVAHAIEAGDTATLRKLAGDLHESDQGALLEALDPEQRTRFVELLGIDFDFSALTEVDDAVREEILDEMPPHQVAEGVRDLESDDAVAILEDLPKEEQAEIARATAAARARRCWRAALIIRRNLPAGACRRNSSPCRRPGM